MHQSAILVTVSSATLCSRIARSTVELKIVPIGNSRGVRLPKEIIERYAIEETIVLEVREEALVFRNKRDKRLSWEDTFKAMAREREDWSDIEGTVADGLDPAEHW